MGDFVRIADELVRSIHSRGMIPVVSGGTAFYLKTYLCGLAEAPPSDPELRENLKLEAEEKGIDGLLDRLSRFDPESASRIDPHDRYRILRALEVVTLSGKPLSAFSVPDLPRTDIKPLLIGLHRERSELYSRIDRRVELMFEKGLVEENKRLISSGCREDFPGMQAIGYREFFTMAKAGCMTFNDVKDLVSMYSRRYAKRQITFFRSIPGVKWFLPWEKREIADTVFKFIDDTAFTDDEDMRSIPP